MAAQISNLVNIAEGLKKNITQGISSAFLKLESNNAKSAKDSPGDEIAEKAIKETLPKNQPGLLVTDALEDALQGCKKKVEAIAKQCRMTNRKFRDIEFDLEKNQFFCQYGLAGCPAPYTPSAVKRVTDIFDKPMFFGPAGPSASDVQQGDLGDCWFLAALSAISTVDGLVKRICVARDEEVGVYGFVFFRDCVWKSVIVDDLLLWGPPKYDELNPREQSLFHNERETYHRVVEKSGKGLRYARSGTVGETWVPLIEKAYAKLHGDYAALQGGSLAEGIEDLTGGVATSFQVSDLLSAERFWTDELLHADRHTRLFGVSLSLDDTRTEIPEPNVQGLWPSHAYSVLRAREVRGKRFVVVRNPWGNSEWTGAWADGSKEWKGEWLGALAELGHEFGDDGQFVMEYSDFLSVFHKVDRATLFDESWVMSSHWLRIPPMPGLHPWTYGEVYYYIKLDKASSAVIVLSQTDDRYYKGLHGDTPGWFLDFLLYKRDPDELVGISGISLGSQRSVSCEVYLEPGEYVVLPRMEPMNRGIIEYNASPEDTTTWSRRKLSRVLAERAESRLLAANYEVWQEIKNIPRAPEVALEVDMKRAESPPPKEDEKDKKKDEKDKKDEEEDKPSEKSTDDKVTAPDAASQPAADTDPKPPEAAEEPKIEKPEEAAAEAKPAENTEASAPKPEETKPSDTTKPADEKPTKWGAPPPAIVTDVPISAFPPGTPNPYTGAPYTAPPPPGLWGNPVNNATPPDSWAEGAPTQPLFLGLRVYTQNEAVAVVSGRLKDA